MEGIVAVTVDVTSLNATDRKQLESAMNELGLGTTLPETQGGTLHLPPGVYASPIEITDQMQQLRHYYRATVDILRRLGIKGKYFVNVAPNPTFVCCEL